MRANGNEIGLLRNCSRNCSRIVERYRRERGRCAKRHVVVGTRVAATCTGSHCAKHVAREATRGAALENMLRMQDDDRRAMCKRKEQWRGVRLRDGVAAKCYLAVGLKARPHDVVQSLTTTPPPAPPPPSRCAPTTFTMCGRYALALVNTFQVSHVQADMFAAAFGGAAPA